MLLNTSLSRDKIYWSLDGRFSLRSEEVISSAGNTALNNGIIFRAEQYKAETPLCQYIDNRCFKMAQQYNFIIVLKPLLPFLLQYNYLER